MNKPKAKLINAIIREPFYFSEYEFECINCGTHYTRAAYNSRISPYCGKCSREIDSIKNKERRVRKKNEAIIKELESIQEEIQDRFNNFKFDYWTADSITRLIGEHINKLKGEAECTRKE